MLSLDFFQMIATQEVFSLCKNGGILGFLAWAVRLSSTNPCAPPLPPVISTLHPPH
jgi:hypothetical protein